jgi:hypothetical protein
MQPRGHGRYDLPVPLGTFARGAQMVSRVWLLAIAGAGLAVGLCFQGYAQSPDAQSVTAQGGAARGGARAAADWPEYNRTVAGERFSPLTQIRRGNLKQLKVHCSSSCPAVGVTPASSYAVGGQQRIGVAAGMNSSIWPGGAKHNRILVYGLP